MRILDLIESVTRDEERRREAPFLAPCVPGGRLRVRVGRLVAELAPEPVDFEGWGVFRQEGDRRAVLVEEAGLPLVDRYLALFAPVRLLLALPVRGRTWFAVA